MLFFICLLSARACRSHVDTLGAEKKSDVPTLKLRRTKRGELYEIPPPIASRTVAKMRLEDWGIGGFDESLCGVLNTVQEFGWS